MTDTKTMESPTANLSETEKREFAQKQLTFLTDNGIKNPRHRSRVFKAAGPGQIVEAFNLYKQADTPDKKDLLDCLLTGAGGSQGMSKERMEKVLSTCGFTPPKAATERAFFRILDGAMELLVPYSFEFSKSEEQEIEAGLQRSRKKYEELKSTEESD